MVAAAAPTDAFFVGTKLAVSEDAPSPDRAYRLAEYAGRPWTKPSAKKVFTPGRRQVFRIVGDCRMVRDVIGRHGETLAGEPLLRPVTRGGVRLPDGRDRLEEARAHARRGRDRHPEPLRSLATAEAPDRVEISASLRADLEAPRREPGAKQG